MCVSNFLFENEIRLNLFYFGVGVVIIYVFFKLIFVRRILGLIFLFATSKPSQTKFKIKIHAWLALSSQDLFRLVIADSEWNCQDSNLAHHHQQHSPVNIFEDISTICIIHLQSSRSLFIERKLDMSLLIIAVRQPCGKIHSWYLSLSNHIFL